MSKAVFPKIQLKLVCKLLLGIIVLLAVIRTINIDEVVTLLKNANSVYLLLCAALLNVDRFFMAFKWSLLLKRDRHQNTGFFPLVKGYYLSSIVSPIVPPTVGEDIVRGVSVVKEGFDTKNVVSSIFMERFLGILAMLILAGVTLFLLTFHYHPQTDDFLFFSVIVFIGILIVVITLSLYFPVTGTMHWPSFLRGDGRLSTFVKKTYSSYQEYRHSKALLLNFVLLSVVENCFVVLGVYWIALSIDTETNLVDMMLTVPAITLFSKIPITVGGIGVQEGIFVKLLSLVGILPSEAFAISVIGRLVNIIAVLPVFLFFLLRKL